MNNYVEYAKSYIEAGLNVMPLFKKSEGKWYHLNKHLFKEVNGWEFLQETKCDLKYFNHRDVDAIGLICGNISGNLEVLDFDTKHDLSGTLWQDFMNAVDVNGLMPLFERLPVVKTKSNGYHIIYRCEHIEGNKKVALNKLGNATIETRGEGGYVNAVPTKGYSLIQGDLYNIPYISVSERTELFSLCAIFDDAPAKPEQKQETSYTQTSGENPFVAYNAHKPTSLLVQYGWTYKNTRGDIDYYSRPNSSSKDIHASLTQKGDSWVFYSFSTNCYPLEANKGYNPVSLYSAFTGKYDKKELAKDFVNMGFGSFGKKQEAPKAERKQEKKKETAPNVFPFPLHVLHPTLQKIVSEYSTKRDMPANLLAMSLLTAFSGAIGLNHKLVLSNGWESFCSLFVALVGNASVGKSPTMDFAMSPLINVEKAYQLEYEKRLAEYKLWEADKDKNKPHMDTPNRYELIISDATLEALITAHNTNKKGLLLHRDELLGWVRGFNSYRKGSDQQAWLSIWSNGMVKNNRKNSGIQFIDKSFVTVFGGLQPAVISELAKENRQEDGFLYRILFVFAEETTRKTWQELNQPLNRSLFAAYSEAIQSLALQPYTDTPTVYGLSDGAQDIWAGWYDSNDDFKSENDEIASISAKLSQYCTRFALLLQVIENAMNQTNSYEVSENNMIGAIQLCEYFKYTAIQALGVIAEQKIDTQQIKGTSSCNWAKVFDGKSEMTTSEICERVLELYGKSEKTARVWANNELKKIKYGVWAI